MLKKELCIEFSESEREWVSKLKVGNVLIVDLTWDDVVDQSMKVLKIDGLKVYLIESDEG